MGDWDWVLDVELMSNIYSIKAFLPHIKQQGEGGHIVSVASMSGFCAPPGLVLTASPNLALERFRKRSRRNSQARQLV